VPIQKIGFRRLLTALGILVVVLLALAFILGITSLKRTQEIVSDDFQQQQLILAKTTARPFCDGNYGFWPILPLSSTWRTSPGPTA
jgi:hypothetical protein